MSQLKEKQFNVFAEFKEVKATDSGELTISGYASTFGNEDRDGETIDPKAFDGALEEFKMNPVVLINHSNDAMSAVGTITDAKIDATGLWVEAKIVDSDDEIARGIRNRIKAGVLKAFSIGGLFRYDYPTIKSIKLLEISIVPIPANGYALFSMAKAWKGLEIDDRKQLDAPEPVEIEEVLDVDGDQPKESGEKNLDESEIVEATDDLAIDYKEQALKELTNIYRTRRELT